MSLNNRVKTTWALAALILVPVLWGGYGVPGQWLVAIAGLALALLVFRRPSTPRTLRPADWLPALLPLGYVLAALTKPASLPSAVAALFGALGMLGVYLSSASTGRRQGREGVTVVWAGFLLVAGATLVVTDAVVSLVPAWAGLLWADHRLSGLWGYANATAVFHALAAFCGAAVAVRRDHPRQRSLAAVLMGINLLAVLATGSRGAVGLAVVGLAVAPIAVVGFRRRATALAGGALTGAVVGATLMWWLAARGVGDGAAMVAGLMAAAVLAPGADRLLAWLLGGLRRPRMLAAAAAGGIAVVLATAGDWAWVRVQRPLFVALPTLVMRSAPLPSAGQYHLVLTARSPSPWTLTVYRTGVLLAEEDLARADVPAGTGTVRVPVQVDAAGPVLIRLSGARGATVDSLSIDGPGGPVPVDQLPARLLPAPILRRYDAAGDYSLWLRLQYARDALRMVAARPLVGWGGGGWAAAYPRFQRAFYYSSEVHNGPLNVWLEGGLLALAGFLALWVPMLWRLWRQGATGRAVAIGLGVVLAHSLLDYDLSYAALTALPAALAGGMAGAGAPGDAPAVDGPPRLRATRAAVALLLAASLAGAVSQGYAMVGESRLKMRPVDALPCFRASTRWNPLNGPAWMGLARAAAPLAPVDPTGMGDVAWGALDRAARLMPLSADVAAARASLAGKLGDLQEAVSSANRAISLAPHRFPYYESLAMSLTQAGIQMAVRRDVVSTETARRLWQDALAIRGRLAAVDAADPPGVPAAFRVPQNSSLTALAWGEDLVLLGRDSEAGPYLRVAMRDGVTRPYALLFQAVVHHVQGDSAGGAALMAQVNLPNRDAALHQILQIVGRGDD